MKATYEKNMKNRKEQYSTYKNFTLKVLSTLLLKCSLAVALFLVTAFMVIGAGVTVEDGSLNVSNDVLVNTNTLFVDSVNDRVGVGTTSPDSPLHVVTDAGNIQLDGNNIGFLLHELDTDVYVQHLFNNQRYRMRGLNSSLSEIATGIVLDITSGNVGINTISPAHKFEVVDDDTTISLFDGRILLNGSTTQPVNAIFEGDSAGFIWQDDNGAVNQKKVQALVNDELFRIRTLSDSDTLVHTGINLDLSTGNVGIGTTSPVATLEVAGDTKVGYKGSGAWFDGRNIIGEGVSNFDYRPTLNGTGNQQAATFVPTYDPQGSDQTLYNLNMNVRFGGSTSNSVGNMYSLFTQSQFIEDYDGVINNLYGLRVNGLASETSSGSPNVTNQWGVWVADPTIDGTDTTVALGSNMQSGDGKYGLYLSGTATNWLEGNTGIGTNTPDTTLEVDGGVEVSQLSGSWSNGEAYVCVYNNGTIFAKDSACS